MEDQCDTKPEENKRKQFLIRSQKSNHAPSAPRSTQDAPPIDSISLLFLKTLKAINSSFIHKLKNSDNICRVILTLPLFRKYKFATMLIHKKGSTYSHLVSHPAHPENSKLNISTEHFYELYLHIKKSKHKHFTNFRKDHSFLNFLGSYIATTLTFKNYSLILCLSRNDFLNPSRDEQTLFKKITTLLRPFLASRLDHDLSEFKLNKTKKLIANLPVKVQTLKKLSSPTIKNKNIINTPRFSLTIERPNQAPSHSSYHYERINLLGELLDTLKHELSNPLFGINLSSNLLLRTSHKEDHLILSQIIEKCKIGQQIIKNFSFLYSSDSSTKKINLQRLTREVIKITKSETRGISIQLHSTKSQRNEFYVKTNPIWLTQILFNLILNSAQAINNSPTQLKDAYININILQNDTSILIEITDNGPGLSDDIQNNIFQPFFTTKEQGTGLGLSICSSLTNQIGGEIQLRQSIPGKTIFCLILPITILCI